MNNDGTRQYSTIVPTAHLCDCFKCKRHCLEWAQVICTAFTADQRIPAPRFDPHDLSHCTILVLGRTLTGRVEARNIVQ